MLDAVPRGIVEEELIGQGTAAAIREMRLRGKSKKAIARELELDIKTVRKWSSEEWAPQRRRARGEELSAYAEVIAKRFAEVGYNAEVLHRELQEAGYEGSARSVRRYVEGKREAARPEVATVRFETGPGEQAQVDWGMINVWIGELRIKVHLLRCRDASRTPCRVPGALDRATPRGGCARAHRAREVATWSVRTCTPGAQRCYTVGAHVHTGWATLPRGACARTHRGCSSNPQARGSRCGAVFRHRTT
jgi:hypothetical protein